jgi:hypothetical protein
MVTFWALKWQLMYIILLICLLFYMALGLSDILMGANLLLGLLEGVCPCNGFARAIDNRHINSYYALNTVEDTKKKKFKISLQKSV